MRWADCIISLLRCPKSKPTIRLIAQKSGSSASYLSDVKHRKCSASANSHNRLNGNKPTAKQDAKIVGDFICGEVSELADEHDLGSCAARRRGSSPLFPIQ